jgi:hypothetical protein
MPRLRLERLFNLKTGKKEAVSETNEDLEWLRDYST